MKLSALISLRNRFIKGYNTLNIPSMSTSEVDHIIELLSDEINDVVPLDNIKECVDIAKAAKHERVSVLVIDIEKIIDQLEKGW